jgi:uncharacterized protein (UPF0333 family)
MNAKKAKGQISLEFLLIITVFFSSLLIILPTINYSSQQIMQANDIILSKQIFQITEKEVQQFAFLADGSRKEFEFIPTKEIMLETKSNTFKISTQNKSFSLTLPNNQINSIKSFSKKFKIIIEKIKGNTIITFE